MTGTLLAARDVRIVSAAGSIVTGVDLDVAAGSALAVVGESGSGKSMLAKALTGLLPRGVRATGTLRLGDTEVDLAGDERVWRPVRGPRVVLLLQDPFTSLSPVHRCGMQVAAALPGLRRMRRTERDARVAAALREVALEPDVAARYPFELSGGMRQRVAIAAALAADPDVLLADEPTTALDVTTQAGILDLLGDLRERRGTGLVLITHDLELARERADEVLVLYAGRVLEHGPAAAVLATPAHPYTRALHEANPPLDVRLDRLTAIEGTVPRPALVAGRCAFTDRCPHAQPVCGAGEPPLVSVAPGRRSACLFAVQELARAATPTRAAAQPQSRRPSPVLAVQGLRKTFPGSAAPALDGVDVLVGAGECVGIVGESGSGKTTLARCVVGLSRPDSGQIRFLGALAPADGADRPAHRLVQIVFQDPYSALDPALSIGATLREALAVADRPTRDVPALLELVGLPAGYAHRRPHALSGGERQRVAIARALAPGPELLVCDESVSALDVSVQAQVLNLLAGLRRELHLSMLFISHDIAVVRQVADEVYVMLRGQVVESGPTEQVLGRPEHPYTRRLMASVPGRVAS